MIGIITASINQYARTPLTAEQIYTMKLTLCDNEIDRQNDQFTPEALKQLAALFIGKTVIFDHTWSAKGQTARIYNTGVESIPGKLTSNGLPYQRLTAMAYMPYSPRLLSSFHSSMVEFSRKAVLVSAIPSTPVPSAAMNIIPVTALIFEASVTPKTALRKPASLHWTG